MKKIILAVRDWFQKLTAAQRRRLALVCTAVFAAVLTLCVFLSMKSRESAVSENEGAPERITIYSPIPAEDLFLPDEPDFIPGIILERDRRQSWTEDDAMEFWQDPLRFGEENWRENIEDAVNKLLERIP